MGVKSGGLGIYRNSIFENFENDIIGYEAKHTEFYGSWRNWDLFYFY